MLIPVGNIDSFQQDFFEAGMIGLADRRMS